MNPFIQSKKQLSIFVTAGYPELISLNEQLHLLEARGIDFVEVGIPFSDPMADGPTIQATSDIALKNGMNLELLFQQLQQRTALLPLVLMGYLNPVLAFGVERFLRSCNETNIRTVILPDMSLEIYERFYRDQFEEFGVYPSFLITPSTQPERIRKVSEVCKNSFVYLVSSNSTTGGLSSFCAEQVEHYKRIKAMCNETPLFIGFGIDSKEKVEIIQNVCDGAIVGSAYLKALQRNKAEEFLIELT